MTIFVLRSFKWLMGCTSFRQLNRSPIWACNKFCLFMSKASSHLDYYCHAPDISAAWTIYNGLGQDLNLVFT